MIWFWRIGIVFSPFASISFARGGDSIYGPYDLWFERIIWPIYWAETKPYKFMGFRYMKWL